MGLLAVGACNPFAGPDDEVLLIVGSAHYVAGEAISFEIRNHSSDNALVPTCSDGTPKVVLLQRISGDWHGRGAQCGTARNAVLKPGGRLTGTRPGVDGPGADGLYALALHHQVLEPPTTSGRAFVPSIANSKAFQITE